MDDCLFCKIVKGEIPSRKVYEDDSVLAFEDISAQCEIHVLFIHKKHSENLNELVDMNLESDVLRAINKWTREKGIEKAGYRLVCNSGEGGGQTVFHTHFHVLSGKGLKGFH